MQVKRRSFALMTIAGAAGLYFFQHIKGGQFENEK
jgi:hypothetical protein